MTCIYTHENVCVFVCVVYVRTPTGELTLCRPVRNTPPSPHSQPPPLCPRSRDKSRDGHKTQILKKSVYSDIAEQMRLGSDFREFLPGTGGATAGAGTVRGPEVPRARWAEGGATGGAAKGGGGVLLRVLALSTNTGRCGGCVWGGGRESERERKRKQITQ